MGFSDHYIEIQGPDIDEAGNNKGYISGKPDFSEYKYITRVLKTISNAPLPNSKTYINLNKGGTRKTRSKRRRTIKNRKHKR